MNQKNESAPTENNGGGYLAPSAKIVAVNAIRVICSSPDGITSTGEEEEME